MTNVYCCVFLYAIQCWNFVIYRDINPQVVVTPQLQVDDHDEVDQLQIGAARAVSVNVDDLIMVNSVTNARLSQ